MNEREQQIAIGLARGWRLSSHPDVAHCFEGWTTAEKWMVDPDGEITLMCRLPKYTTDLNACHEMEKGLSEFQVGEYWDRLYDLGGHCPFKQTCATAKQRCEAFLRTVGKWEEKNDE